MEPVRGARKRVENAPGRFSSGSGVFSQAYVISQPLQCCNSAYNTAYYGTNCSCYQHKNVPRWVNVVDRIITTVSKQIDSRKIHN